MKLALAAASILCASFWRTSVAESLVQYDTNTNEPFTPSSGDGFLFEYDTGQFKTHFVDGKTHRIQTVQLETLEPSVCSSTGCMGQEKVFIVSSVKTAYGEERVVLTSNDWGDIRMSCPSSSQTPSILDSRCFSDGTYAGVTIVRQLGPIIDELSDEHDRCDGESDEQFITVTFLCRSSIYSKPATHRYTAKSGIKPFTPSGKFLFAFDGSTPLYVDESIYKLQSVAPPDNESAGCSSTACFGDGHGFAIQGRRSPRGEKVVIAGKNFNNLYMLCPFGYQTAEVNSVECVDDGNSGDTSTIVDKQRGPYIHFDDDDCATDHVRVEIECVNPRRYGYGW